VIPIDPLKKFTKILIDRSTLFQAQDRLGPNAPVLGGEMGPISGSLNGRGYVARETEACLSGLIFDEGL
jgi:hypothetical protein